MSNSFTYRKEGTLLDKAGNKFVIPVAIPDTKLKEYFEKWEKARSLFTNKASLQVHAIAISSWKRGVEKYFEDENFRNAAGEKFLTIVPVRIPKFKKMFLGNNRWESSVKMKDKALLGRVLNRTKEMK